MLTARPEGEEMRDGDGREDVRECFSWCSCLFVTVQCS